MCCLPAPCQLLRCSRSSSSHPCSAQCSYEVFFPKMLFCFFLGGSCRLWWPYGRAWRALNQRSSSQCLGAGVVLEAQAGGSCLAVWGQHGPKGRDKCGEVIRGCPRGAGSGGGGDALGRRLRGRGCDTVPLWHRSSRAPHLLPPQLPLFSALCSVPASLRRTGCSSAAFRLTLEQLHKQAEPRLFSAQRFIDNLCLSTV